MARLSPTPNLTQGYRADIAQQIHQTHRGQAHFAGTGPFTAKCAECALFNAWKRKRNAAGEIIGTARVSGACEKYRQLTGKLGPVIPSNTAACNYFERKEERNNQNQRDL
jgi:hypothetical protein